jgi:HK97 family phage major capsid protein
MTLVQAQQEKARVLTQMEALSAKVKAEKRGLNTEELENWRKLAAADDQLDDQIKALKSEQTALSEMDRRIATGRQAHNPGGIADVLIDGVPLEEYRMTSKAVRDRNKVFEKDPHARAFHNYLVQPREFGDGLGGLQQEDRAILSRFQNAQSGTVGSQGGYLIPTGFSENLFEAMLWFGGIDGVVGEFETATGNPWPWPTVNDTTNKGRIIGQDVQIAETDIVFGQVTFNAYIGSSDLVLIPLALMEDSYFDMDALVARLLGIRLGRLLNQKCTIGSGTAEPTGIVTAAVTAGNVLTLGAGNTASIAYNNLVDLEHSVDPAYRFNPATRWMFSDTMLKLIKKLVDGNNRPLWQPGLTASFREGAAVDLVASKPTILDHPYVINQDMAVPAANAYSMLFGDMSCYKLRRVSGGVTVLRLVERYADYLQVGFTAFMRIDGNLIDAGTHPVAALQQSAT